MSTIPRIPKGQNSSDDGGFFRVEGSVYLHPEVVTLDQGIKHEANGLFVPTFSLDEDDIVGLSIDAFREHILLSEMGPLEKESWLKMQQIVAMMKRVVDAELLGKKQKMFKKIEVVISGESLDFKSAEPYLVGQVLRLAMFFPRFPFTYLCVIGDVIKCEKTDDGHIVKTHFKEISEKNQDEILRFVNQCQRDQRRR